VIRGSSEPETHQRQFKAPLLHQVQEAQTIQQWKDLLYLQHPNNLQGGAKT